MKNVNVYINENACYNLLENSVIVLGKLIESCRAQYAVYILKYFLNIE